MESIELQLLQKTAETEAPSTDKEMSGFTSYIGSVSVDTGTGSLQAKPQPDLLAGEIIIASANNVFCSSPCQKEDKNPHSDSPLNREKNLSIPKHWSPKPTRKSSFRRKSHLRNPSPIVPETRQRRVKSWFGQTSAEMESVAKFGQKGSLFITNLKLSFIPEKINPALPFHNKIIKELELPLSSIYAVDDMSEDIKEKKKRFQFNSTCDNKHVEGLFITCKNFKCMKLNFNVSEGSINGRKITNALLHHCRPQNVDLLFPFLNKLDKTPTPKTYSLFKKKAPAVQTKESADWRKILEYSQAPDCRLSLSNETWQISTSLPPRFVTPAHSTDSLLADLAGIGQGCRPPVWVWGTKTGGALFVQPQLAVPPSQHTENLEKTFYNNQDVTFVDLDKLLPSRSKLEDSLAAIISLHCVDSEDKLQEIDSKYFSSLEASGWMTTLSAVLELSLQVAESIDQGDTIVLREGESRTTSLLVASVAQILLDEKFRTRKGFESLVQSNWVSLGFPFVESHNLCGDEGAVNPIFLIFLDCVHQMGAQFPASLEFTEDYLLTVWDTALLPIFDTFIFDSEHEREKSSSFVELRSAWDWTYQFSQTHIEDWDNPLYGIPISLPTKNSTDPSEASMSMDREEGYPDIKQCLPIQWQVASLNIWDKLLQRSLRSVHALEKDTSGEEQIHLIRKKAKKIVLDAKAVRNYT